MAAFTSKDVARIAGVSQSTVSYVMTGKRPISERTRQRVLDAMRELTYEPHSGARALAGRRTQVVGLVVPFGAEGDTFGLLPFIETIASSARERDHDVLLVTRDEGSAGLTRLASRSLCDAIVLMDIEARDARIPVAAALAVPVILIGLPADPAGLPCVDLDFDAAGRLAVAHLADDGHDRIAVIGHPPDIVARDLNFLRRFRRGAAEEAWARGLPCDIHELPERGPAGVRAAVERALATRGRAGLVVPNTEVVPAVLQLVAGRNVSVVGLCPDVMAEATTPPVTNVSLEPRDVSRRAMDTLFRLLARDPLAEIAPIDLITPRLTRRQTSHPA